MKLTFLQKVFHWHERGRHFLERFFRLQIVLFLSLCSLKKRKKEKILFWVPGGMPLLLHVEGALALGLKLRGASVHAIICDGILSGCVKREIITEPNIAEWSSQCTACKKLCTKTIKRFGIPYSYLGDYITPLQKKMLRKKASQVSWDDLKAFSHHNVEIGSNIRSSVLRYLKGLDFTDQKALLAEYVFSGLVTTEIAQRVLAELQPTQTVMSHGTYVDWGPALKVFSQRQLPITLWMSSYLKSAFYFRTVHSPEDISPHRISEATWKAIKQKPLTKKQEKDVEEYFHQRYALNQCFDMREYTPLLCDRAALRKQLVPAGEERPLWCLFTHINWDTVCDWSPMLFETFNLWVQETLTHIASLTQTFWLIKVHPAEQQDSHGQTTYHIVQDILKKNAYSHIAVIPPEAKMNPLDLYHLIDGGVTALGTSGLELTTYGKPVILAGRAHYAERGFTYDSLTKEDYFQWLTQAHQLASLSPQQRELAQLYMYYFVKKRQIYLPFMDKAGETWWQFDFFKYHHLLPGKTAQLDFILETLLAKREFVLP